MEESFYYQYEHNGGDMIMPKEIFWDLWNDYNAAMKTLDDLEEWINFCKDVSANSAYSMLYAFAYDDILEKIKTYKENNHVPRKDNNKI